MFIKRGKAKIIKNSRKENTIFISLTTYHGTFSCSAPSGKSKGKNEVPDYNERGIFWSVKLVNQFVDSMVNQNLVIKKIDDLKEVEKKIKEFEKDFGNLGGNVTYALETAILKAAAKEYKKDLWQFIFDDMSHKNLEFPMPIGNCIGGGLHSKGVNGIKPDFQEFQLIGNSKKFSTSVTRNIYGYFYAKKLLKKKHKKVKPNDENAWNTSLSNEDVLDVLSEVAKKYDLKIGLDVAASSFFKNGYYHYKNKELVRDRNEQVEYIKKLIEKYNLLYVEDPLQEEDFSSFKQLLSQVKSTLIVGDDLTTTNMRRLERAFRAEAINAIIVKPNQIGSILEVKKVMEFCKKNKIKTIFSHRSGETMDDSIADYALGFQSDYIKTGIYGPERLIKLKRLMDIERKFSEKV